MDAGALAALRRRLTHIGLAAASLVFLAPAPGLAQVLQMWSHASPPRSDISGAVAIDDTLVFVDNNEDAVLRLYARYPSVSCAATLYTKNVESSLGFTGSDLTADLESAAKRVDTTGTKIFWLGSLGNSASGNLRPNRNRVFATRVNGNGTGTPPYTLTYLGRYDKLRDDVLAWDTNNGHGLGASYFGLAASAASGVSPKLASGFNVEGLAFTTDGSVAYLGCRTPLVNPSGPTTTLSPRTDALIIPVLNLPSLVTGNPTPGPGAAQFGPPIVLPLGGRGIRSIDRISTGEFLIVAGPADTVSVPPVAPLDFRVFLWSGHPQSAPIELTTTFAASESPEACLPPAGALTSSSVAQFINDDGGANCWRSMTCPIGSAVSPAGVPAVARLPDAVRFSRPPFPSPAHHAVSFAIALAGEESVDVSILDVSGRRVATVWHGRLPHGERTFAWSGETETGSRATAGVYWVSLRAGPARESRPFAWRP
jgi:hypothetical protein